MANDVKVGGALLEVKASDNKALKVINNFVNIVDKLGQQIQKTGQAASNQANKATAAVDAQAKKTKQFAYTVTSSSKEVVKGVDSWGKAVDGYKTKINSSEKATTKSTSKIKQGFDDLSKKATGSINTIQKGFTAFGNSVKRVVTEPKQAMRDLGQTATTAASKIKGAFTSGFARIKNSSQDSSKSMSSDIKDFAKRSVQNFNEFRNKGTEAFLANRREAKSFKEEADKSTFSVKKLVGAIGLLKAGAMVFSKLGAAAGKALARIDVTEQFNRNMTVMLGTKEAAKDLYDEVRKIVTGTAYGLDTALNAAKSFTTSGLKNVPKVVGGWADAVAFFGDGTDETFQRVTYQLGQMAAKGKANLGDLMSATEAGIPVTQLYAAATGKSVEEVSKAISDGSITADEFFQTMDKVFTEGAGKFPAIAGAATKAGNSWKGVFDNFNAGLTRGMQSIILAVDGAVQATGRQDLRANIAAIGKLAEAGLNQVAALAAPVIQLIDLIIRRIQGLTIIQQIVDLVKRLADMVKKELPSSAQVFEALTKSINFLFDVLEKIMPVIVGVVAMLATFKIVLFLTKAFELFTLAVGALNIAFVTLSNLGLGGTIKMLLGFANPVTLVVALIVGLVTALVYAYKTSDTFRAKVDALASWLRDKFGTALEWSALKAQQFGDLVARAMDRVAGAINSFKEAAQQAGSAFMTRFGDQLIKVKEVAVDALAVAMEALRAIVEKLGDAFAWSMDKIKGGLDKVKNAFGGAFDLLEKWGGKFGAMGAVIGLIAGQLVKVGLAIAGVSGPMGFIISAIAAILIAMAKTGNFSADGLTAVFDSWAESIENVAGFISDALPGIVDAFANILVEIVGKITDSIPLIVNVITSILDTIVNTITTVLPVIITAGVNLLTSLIDGILSALPAIIGAVLNVVTTIIDAFATYYPKLMTLGVDLLVKLITGITKALPVIVKVGIKIINGLIQGILKVLPLLLNAALKIVTGLVGAIVKALPQIIGAGVEIIGALIGAIITALPALIEAAIQIILTIVSALITALPSLIDAAIQIVLALVTGIIGMLPVLIDAAIQIIMALLGALIGALPQIIDAGIKLIMALIQGIIQVLPQLIAAAIKIIVTLVTVLAQNLPKIIAAGVQILVALIKGIIQVLPQLIAAAFKLIITLVVAILQNLPKLLGAGAKLILELVKGVLSIMGALLKAGGDLAAGLLRTILGFGGKMLNAGGTLISKMVQGIKNGIKSVGDAARSVGNALLKPINGAVNGVLKGINWVLDKVGADKKLDLWELPKFEKGSKGLSRDTIGVVNDGQGRNYQEIIKEPGRDPYMFKGRNIVAPLKKGTEIVPGHATAEIMKDKRVPKFKKGTGGFWSGLKGGVVNVGKKIKDTALDVWDFVSEPGKLVDKAVEMFTDTTGIIQPWLSATTGSIRTVKDGAMDMVVGFIEDKFSSNDGFDGDVGAHGVYSYLVDAAKKTMAKFPGMSVTSGYRPGDPYSHGKRQAIDIAYPSGMNGSSRYFDPANWVFEKFPKLISYVITQGKVRDRSGMSGQGSSGQWRGWPDNDHYDHLHINGLLGAGDIYNSTGDGGKQGAGVERWRSTAIKALKMEGQYSAANLNALLYQMKTESGGNPRAINNWDTNAMNGTPSKGLTQVIDPTFRSNARPGFNSNIYDPLSNILASIRYSVRRYGSLTNAYRGVGYANGGWVDKDGLYRMGEGNQPEVVIPVTKPRLAIPLILEALNFMGLGAKSVLAQVSDSLMGASTGLSIGSLSNSYNGLSGSTPNPGQNNGGALNELVGLVRGLREDIDNGKIGVYIDKKTTGAVLFDENDKLGGDMTRLNERGVLQ